MKGTGGAKARAYRGGYALNFCMEPSFELRVLPSTLGGTMDAVLERMFTIYAQMIGELKRQRATHVRELFEAGEADEERLTVQGLTYLKRSDGSPLTRSGGNPR
jgi:hypothetical protein